MSLLLGGIQIAEINPGLLPTPPENTVRTALFIQRQRAGQEIRVLFSSFVCVNYVRGGGVVDGETKDEEERDENSGKKLMEKGKHRYISQICHHNGHGSAHTRWRAVKTGEDRNWGGNAEHMHVVGCGLYEHISPSLLVRV